MRLRALSIFVIILLALVPVYYMNRALNKLIKPREAAGRFFLFLFANFLLIVVYTLSIVAIVVRLFPVK